MVFSSRASVPSISLMRSQLQQPWICKFITRKTYFFIDSFWEPSISNVHHNVWTNMSCKVGDMLFLYISCAEQSIKYNTSFLRPRKFWKLSNRDFSKMNYYFLHLIKILQNMKDEKGITRGDAKLICFLALVFFPFLFHCLPIRDKIFSQWIIYLGMGLMTLNTYKLYGNNFI